MSANLNDFGLNFLFAHFTEIMWQNHKCSTITMCLQENFNGNDVNCQARLLPPAAPAGSNIKYHVSWWLRLQWHQRPCSAKGINQGSKRHKLKHNQQWSLRTQLLPGLATLEDGRWGKRPDRQNPFSFLDFHLAKYHAHTSKKRVPGLFQTFQYHFRMARETFLCAVCGKEMRKTQIYRVFFSTGPTPKSSKYGTGPTQ